MLNVIELTKKEKEFIGSYFEAVYFTNTGDIDEPVSDAELCPEFERESIIDCLSFFSRIQCYLSDSQISQAGHDFWMTRNHHGVGFWEKDDWPKYGEEFNKIALSYGESCPHFQELVV